MPAKRDLMKTDPNAIALAGKGSAGPRNKVLPDESSW